MMHEALGPAIAGLAEVLIVIYFPLEEDFS